MARVRLERPEATLKELGELWSRRWGKSSQSPAEKTQPYGGGFKGKVPGAVRKRSIRRYEEDNHEEKNNYR